MLKKLINGQINSITIAALLVGLSSLISRFLGIFRDHILAGQFGAGDTLDIYYAAFRIPDLIFNLLVLGALSAGFIPIFTTLLKNPLNKLKGIITHHENQEAWELAADILNIIIIALTVLSLFGIILAPYIMKFITPGFSGDKLAQTASLARIMFLSPIFLGISSVIGGCLQSFKRFFVYSMSPILYNVGIIIGALFLVPKYGVYGLAWGVVMGAFLHMLVQIPTFAKLGFRYKFSLGLKKPEVRKIGLMMIPRTLSLAITQINLLIVTGFASTLAGGSLAIFNLANNLQSFPVGIFGISFAVAAFPVFSRYAFSKDKLIYNFSRTVRQVLFFIVPASIIMFALRAQIVRIILGTGRFDWEDTVLTMTTLGFFCFSLFAQAIIPILTRVFYARHDSKTPFYIGIFSTAINFFLSYYLSRKMGVPGLALAFAADSIINMSLLWVALNRELGKMDEKVIALSLAKFLAAGTAAIMGIQGMKKLVWPYVDMTKFLGVFSQAAFAALFGILIYLAVCSLLKSDELFSFWESFKRRLPWNKVEVADQGEARGI